MSLEGVPQPSEEKMNPSDANTLYAVRRSIEGFSDKEKLAALKSHLDQYREARIREIEGLPLPEGLEDHPSEIANYRMKELDETIRNPETLLGAIQQDVNTLELKMKQAGKQAAEASQTTKQKEFLQTKVNNLKRELQRYRQATGVREDDNTEQIQTQITALEQEMEQ